MTAGHIRQLYHRMQWSLLDAHARLVLSWDGHLQSGIRRLLGGTGVPSISAARTPSCTMSSTTPLAARRIPLCADAFVRLSVCCGHHREPQQLKILVRTPLHAVGSSYDVCADAFVRLSVCCSRHREPQQPPDKPGQPSSARSRDRPNACMQVIWVSLIGWAWSHKGKRAKRITWMAGGLSVKSLSIFPGDTGSFPFLSWSCPLD